MGIFSKKKTKPVTTSKTSNLSFYLRENHISLIKDFFKMTDFKPDENTLNEKTSKNITFAGLPLDKITPEKIIEILDSPSFVYDNNENIPGHFIYFYRQTGDLIKFLIQIHFINDKCVFVNNKISSTAITLSEKDKERVIEKVFNKLGLTYSSNNINIYVTDNNGNKLYSVDSVHYYLNYVPKDEILEPIRDSLLKIQPKDEEEDEIENTLDKFL